MVGQAHLGLHSGGHIRDVRSPLPLAVASPVLRIRDIVVFSLCFAFYDIQRSTMTELTWSKWTVRRDPVGTGQTPDDGGAGEEEFVLRPAWQRAGVCLVHLGTGLGLATLLFIGRSRVVRRLHILPAGSVSNAAQGKQLFIQGQHNVGANGAIVPFKHAHLQPGRDDTEIILRVDGVRGHWWIGLTSARINGQKLHPKQVKEEMLDAWGIRKKNAGLSESGSGSDGRWIGGPILRNS